MPRKALNYRIEKKIGKFKFHHVTSNTASKNIDSGREPILSWSKLALLVSWQYNMWLTTALGKAKGLREKALRKINALVGLTTYSWRHAAIIANYLKTTLEMATDLIITVKPLFLRGSFFRAFAKISIRAGLIFALSHCGWFVPFSLVSQNSL